MRGGDGGRLSILIDYLERHIELDGDRHGPMAAQLLEAICGDDEAAWTEAWDGATVALEARITLWSGVVAALDTA